MSTPELRITVEDLVTGEKETRDIAADDYVIITTGKCHVASKQIYPVKGTHVLTIKERWGT